MAWSAQGAPGVALVLDVRQLRGVRGSEYAWANSARLQSALAGAGIEYRHHRELAPTTELRQLQYREDDRLGVGKRSRVGLAAEYRERYVCEILGQVDLAPIVAGLPIDAASALLCDGAFVTLKGRIVPQVASTTTNPVSAIGAGVIIGSPSRHSRAKPFLPCPAVCSTRPKVYRALYRCWRESRLASRTAA